MNICTLNEIDLFLTWIFVKTMKSPKIIIFALHLINFAVLFFFSGWPLELTFFTVPHCKHKTMQGRIIKIVFILPLKPDFRIYGLVFNLFSTNAWIGLSVKCYYFEYFSHLIHYFQYSDKNDMIYLNVIT